MRRTPRRRVSPRGAGLTASAASVLIAAALQARMLAADGQHLGPGAYAALGTAGAIAGAAAVAAAARSRRASPPPPGGAGTRVADAPAGGELYDWEAADRVRRRMISVRETDDGRGLGAFAVERIPRGTCLGDYEGALLDQRQFFERYGDGFGAYAVAVDDDWVIDGADEAAQRRHFRNSHINHSARRANVVKRVYPERRRVVFYLSADVDAGAELLLDYGGGYWRGREHLIIGD